MRKTEEDADGRGLNADLRGWGKRDGWKPSVYIGVEYLFRSASCFSMTFSTSGNDQNRLLPADTLPSASKKYAERSGQLY
jgi:hypothetical protein